VSALRNPFIAIVDDDSALANHLRTSLSRRGYEARSYSHGDELIAAVKAGERPDFLLLDVMMPGIDGTDTLGALRSADLQVIVRSRDRTMTIVELAPSNVYVVKPGAHEGPDNEPNSAISRELEQPGLVGEIRDILRQVTAEQDRAVLLWSNSAEMSAVTSLIDQASHSNQPVLIRGETGVGKELVAHAIHQRSRRGSRPFTKVNCAALPTVLLESEPFGHDRDDLSISNTKRVSKLEQADTGTIFLDEIDELKAPAQAKLIRAFQDGGLTLLAGNKNRAIDVRIVATTRREFEATTLTETFRKDLYDRSKVIEVAVPPLRKRRGEIQHLCDFFIDRYTKVYNRPIPRMSAWLRHAFLTYPWPGNIRELENIIKRLVILQDEQWVVREMIHVARSMA
jgi:two-component system, NtrC family, response regulator AtoC